MAARWSLAPTMIPTTTAITTMVKVFKLDAGAHIGG
jgi:hypothetical protein